MLGMHGARYTNQVIDSADLLIAIGVRFDDRATGTPTHFAPRAKIIHIDIDPRELGKIKPPTLAIVDDAARATRQLLKTRTYSPSRYLRRNARHAQIRDLRKSHPLRMPRAEQTCSPYGIMRALGKLLPRGRSRHNRRWPTPDVGQPRHSPYAVPVDG